MGRFIAIICCIVAAALGAQAALVHDDAAKGDLARVKALIAQKPSLVNARDKDGATPLHYAAAKGDAEIIRFLLSKKADVGACKKDGVTPLHVAVALGHKDAVEALLKAKANPNAKDKKGRTPITLAQANGFTEIEQLLARGSTPAAVAAKPPQPPLNTSQLIGPEPDSGAATKQDVIALGREFVSLVTKGDYVTACGKMDANMKRLLPPDKIASTWKALTTQLGAFVGLGDARVEKVQGFDLVHVKCQFEKATYDAQVTYDNSGLISGFYILKPQKDQMAQ